MFRLGNLGASKFVTTVPGTVNPRALSGVVSLIKVFGDLGVGVETCPDGAPSGPPPPQSGAMENNMFLGQVMLASARQDSKAIEELTAQVDATDALRKLVEAAHQGEPLRELEPDEAALRAAATARKSGRFPQVEQPKADCFGKQTRPLPQLLVDVLPRLWAAVLEGRCTWGDPLNWVGHVAFAANDRTIHGAAQSESAAALYGQKILHDAYCASKRGESDVQGRENTSSVLGEMNWSLLQRSQAELAAAGTGNAGQAGRNSGGAQVDKN